MVNIFIYLWENINISKAPDLVEMNKFAFYLLILVLINASCTGISDNEPLKRGRNSGGAVTYLLADDVPAEQLEAGIPLLKTYNEMKQAALSGLLPVVVLPEDEMKDAHQRLAQQIALSNPGFTRDVRFENKQPLHTEILSVRQLTPAELEKLSLTPLNNKDNPYRVELYNYYHNTLTVAYVDVYSQQVLNIEYSSSAPPTLNGRLKEIAVGIAINTPEVIEATGVGKSELKNNFYPEFENTKCERCRHLCAAPVFTVNGKQITVIVDLTDMRVVGLSSQMVSAQKNKSTLTERTLQNEYVSNTFCGKETRLDKAGWGISYELTSSDGLEIKNVSFQDRKVIESAKLVDWHVSYSFKEGFGYSDAVGCPMFSAAAVVAFSGPEVEDILSEGNVVGFAIVQDFRSPVWPMACNYRYQNRYEFYQDGRFRIAGVNLGLGCGTGGWYRPVFRIALETARKFEQWNAGNWDRWTNEAWHLQDNKTTYSPEGYLFKMTDNNGMGYFIEPARGQFGVGDRGDNAFTYVVVQHSGEGEQDISTFGDCCNTDFKQGPEQYLAAPESLEDGKLVFWYVPQIENDDREGNEYCWAKTVVKDGQRTNLTWPGIVGPMFVPVQ